MKSFWWIPGVSLSARRVRLPTTRSFVDPVQVKFTLVVVFGARMWENWTSGFAFRDKHPLLLREN